jgi:hypothetical protein
MRALVIPFVVSLLAACGGGGGGGGEAPAPGGSGIPPASAFSVTAVQPDTSDRVPRTTEIAVTFNRALTPGTANASNLSLTRAGEPVPGTVAYDAAARKATFTPQGRLDLLASYTATAGTGFRDDAGNRLPAERSWSFATADGNWQAPRRLDADNVYSNATDIAIDPEHNAVAVWATGLANSEVRTASYVPGRGWSQSAVLGPPGNTSAGYPKVRLDALGNGLAVWAQFGDSSTAGSVWAARYVKGQGWLAPSRLDGDASFIAFPELVMDAQGNAFAAWFKPVDSQRLHDDIWVARFTPAGGWQPATRLFTPRAESDSTLVAQLAMDGAGNAYLVWRQFSGPDPLWFARFTPGSGWTRPESLRATTQVDAFQLAVSAQGQVMVIWGGAAETVDLWWSTLSSPTGRWSTPALLETDGGDVFRHALVADGEGNFHAAWAQGTSSTSSVVRYRQYWPGTGWTGVNTISDVNGPRDANALANLVADRNGNVLALWNSGRATFARRYVGNQGWQPATRWIATAGSWTQDSALAVAPDGSIAAAWTELDGTPSRAPVSVSILE